MNVTMLMPYRYLKAGQVYVVSEEAGKKLIASGYAVEQVVNDDITLETKEKPKKLFSGKESE